MIDETKVRKHYEKLTKYLIKNKRTITTMESATAGQIASLITDTEGSSAILPGAVVTYSNDVKEMYGVPEQLMEFYGVYSKECAQAMAESCRRHMEADIGIGITGTFGNVDPNNIYESRPGEVYFAFAFPKRTLTYEVRIAPQPSRYAYKLAAAEEVYKKLREELGMDEDDENEDDEQDCTELAISESEDTELVISESEGTEIVTSESE